MSFVDSSARRILSVGPNRNLGRVAVGSSSRLVVRQLHAELLWPRGGSAPSCRPSCRHIPPASRSRPRCGHECRDPWSYSFLRSRLLQPREPGSCRLEPREACLPMKRRRAECASDWVGGNRQRKGKQTPFVACGPTIQIGKLLGAEGFGSSARTAGESRPNATSISGSCSDCMLNVRRCQLQFSRMGRRTDGAAAARNSPGNRSKKPSRRTDRSHSRLSSPQRCAGMASVSAYTFTAPAARAASAHALKVAPVVYTSSTTSSVLPATAPDA